MIHEGQLGYQERGLLKVVDLGEWWKSQTGLPLPLGCKVVRKDLGKEIIRKLERLMKKSIEYALSHREEALSFATKYAREIKEDKAKVGRFVSIVCKPKNSGLWKGWQKGSKATFGARIQTGYNKSSTTRCCIFRRSELNLNNKSKNFEDVQKNPSRWL